MHPECVEEKARVVMSRLGPTLGMHGAVLAGGTGLALHLGHRVGVDLEFATQRPFRSPDIVEELKALAAVVEPVATEPDQVAVIADGAQLSLRHEPVRLTQPTTRVNGCDVAGIVDMAATMVLAIDRDGARSDFIDLHAVLQTTPFRAVARNAIERYGAIATEPLRLGRCLVWFEQADVQGDPAYVGAPTRWEDVKEYFRSSLQQFVLDLEAERQSAWKR
jgi:hypothetical protein